MARACRRLSLLLPVAALFALEAPAAAATRAVSVGPGLTHTFVDELSGTSTSTIAVGDTVEWTWASGLHSTTSGPCAPLCTPDGKWDSGAHATPFSFSHTATFAMVGTYHYHCSVHGAMMQGDIVVVDPGPAPTVTAIAPTSGPADSGTAVVIGGTNFVAGATATIGGVAATGVSVQDPATIDATTPVLLPGTLNDVTVSVNNPDAQAATLAKGWFADFTDVAAADPFHDYVEKLVRNGVTAGCGSGNYCRNDSVTRAQMAVFLLKSKFGANHTPPACTGTVFDDVPCTGGAFDPWIEELASLQVTGGCQASPPLYCPGNPVNRQQMAVFLLKMKNGSAFVPPACTGVFDDVVCTPGAGFSDWIEKLYADAVTGGCQAVPLLYCPTSPNTRGQMAVFLVKNFNLP
jgi:plastocyanin